MIFQKSIRKKYNIIKNNYGEEIQRENLLANILNCIDKLLLEKKMKKLLMPGKNTVLILTNQ